MTTLICGNMDHSIHRTGAYAPFLKEMTSSMAAPGGTEYIISFSIEKSC
jgi:hypothetical protein